MLRIAVQKSGRLKEESLKLFRSCGFRIDNGKDQLKVSVSGFPAEIYYLRNSDIPGYLRDGIIDLAIIGENTLVEKNVEVDIIEKLGFSKCRLSIAIPKGIESYEDMRWLDGKKIATSYPHTLTSYLNEHDIKAEIHLISGSVEIAPNIGLADAICDLVSSGSTLFKNGLEEKQIILRSQACLAANRKALEHHASDIEQLRFRIRSVLKAKASKYILMNVPNEKIKEVSNILPVLKSPTVLPLVEEGWSSLHSVIAEDDFWSVINQLKELGAEGILVIPIEKMVE